MPVIETACLLLRRPAMDDLDGYAEAWGDPDVMRYLPGRTPRTREQAAAALQALIGHWDEHGYGFGSVVLKDTGNWIGYCGIRFLPDSTETELGYGPLKRYWGQGLTTEAAHAWVRYGFEQVGLDRIVAVADLENGASRRVMEHVGMRYEKRARFFGLDTVYYALDRDQSRPAAGLYLVREGDAGSGR
jgi:ribosomal-protein-alanine N-acetyltransferase